jgi:hypothetical protein
MTNIPDHVRRNHDRTSERLDEARAMLRAVEQMAEAARLPHSPETRSMFVLISATQDRLFEVDQAHVIEWVGHGGKTAEMMLEEPGEAEYVQE